LCPSTDWDDVSSYDFYLHTSLPTCFVGKLCEASWPLFSLVASPFDADLFCQEVPLVFSVIWLMKLQKCSENFGFQAKLE